MGAAFGLPLPRHLCLSPPPPLDAGSQKNKKTGLPPHRTRQGIRSTNTRYWSNDPPHKAVRTAQPLHARPSLRWSADERGGRVERGRAAAQSVRTSTMARPPGADDEYQELQKRFQILESERKNLFEHTQLEVKKNKEALGKLKKENKELRSNLSSLMCVPVPCAPARARSPATTPPRVGSPPAAAC